MATFTGTSTADTIFGTTAADAISGLAGDDVLVGGGGNDVISGGAGNDTINGGAGADRITPGSNLGYDYLRASRGADRYDFTGADTSSYYEVDYSGLSRGITASLRAASGTVRKVLDGTTDTLVNLNLIRGDAGGGLGLIGSLGNDRITSNLGPGKFIQIDGHAGDDTITGSATSFERLVFTSLGDGIAVRVTSSASGQMTGTAVDGFGDADSFSNIDQIVGTRWNDAFTGSSGADTFVPERGADTVAGGAGVDVVRYDRFGIETVVADLQTGVVQARWSGVNETDRLTSIEEFRSGGGADTLRGSSVVNDLRGGAGADLIEGRAGADRLFGEAGDDRLNGGTGSDTLSGGTGVDRFVFNSADGDDVITDFADGVDRIVIDSGATNFAGVRVLDAGANVLIDFADTTITIAALDHRLITTADFEFI